MGLFGRKKGKWREIRQGYQSLPRDQWTDDEEAHWWSHCSEEEYWAEWERWSRETVEHPHIKKIKRGLLEMAREAAAATDADSPAEFACLLEVIGDTVTELVLLPGTVAGDEHAIFNLWMAPVDASVRGSLHSHPDEHPYPSDADFELFDKYGEIHLILCRPYGPGDWRAYAHDGTPVHLEVVD